MMKYKFNGYNSSGYRSSLEIEFDGKLEKLWRKDSEYPDTERTVSYFQITLPDGTKKEKNDNFMQELINKSRGYIESFYVSEIIELKIVCKIGEVGEYRDDKTMLYYLMSKELVNLLVLKGVMYHDWKEENIIIKDQKTIMTLAIRENLQLHSNILIPYDKAFEFINLPLVQDRISTETPCSIANTSQMEDILNIYNEFM